MRRVVVTGLGAITPIGNTVPKMWEAVKEGKCGIDKITLFDTTGRKVTLAGEVKNFVPDENCDLDIVANEGRTVKVDYAMSNSLGFGGHNATVVFKKYVSVQ